MWGDAETRPGPKMGVSELDTCMQSLKGGSRLLVCICSRLQFGKHMLKELKVTTLGFGYFSVYV